ncbi:MAG: hypothetical protein ACKVUS_21730 [Saprospiraceae bacterium]
MSQTATPKRIFLVVWDWNKGSHRIPPEGSDEWGTPDTGDVLVRADWVNSPKAIPALSGLIAGYLQEGHHVLAFLHSNSKTHGYDPKSCRQILEQLAQDAQLAEVKHLGRLKINLFSGGEIPIYYNPARKLYGFLGIGGNFPRKFQDSDTAEETQVEFIHSAQDKLLHPEPFRHVWSHYWVSTRAKVYSLMENLRLWTDDFDPADHKRFTQHLREEKGLLWPQLAHFTENKIELKKLSKQPEQRVSEASDFSQCEQHVKLAYGSELGDLYRKARSIVEQVAFLKSHKDAEAFIAARDEMYNALDALQHQLAEHGEALSYDTIALFPR